MARKIFVYPPSFVLLGFPQEDAWVCEHEDKLDEPHAGRTVLCTECRDALDEGAEIVYMRERPSSENVEDGPQFKKRIRSAPRAVPENGKRRWGVATYTEEQMGMAFLAGANRGMEEATRQIRLSKKPSRTQALRKLRKEWPRYLNNIENGRPYFAEPNGTK